MRPEDWGRLANPPERKFRRKFESAAEARASLAADKLGAAYRTAGGVFVVTAHGTGSFSVAEWEAGH